MYRVENQEVFIFVEVLVGKGDEVSLNLAVLLVIETEYGLVAWIGNLL